MSFCAPPTFFKIKIWFNNGLLPNGIGRGGYQLIDLTIKIGICQEYKLFIRLICLTMQADFEK